MFNSHNFRQIVCFIFLLSLLTGCKTQSKKEFTEVELRAFQENLIKANKGLVSKDQEDIVNYLAKNNFKMQKTQTGLWYEILNNKQGKKAKTGMTATLKYKISLLNGNECYSSDSLGVKTFKIGQGGVESGLEEGVLLLNEGNVARFILPPHLAYGLLGDENKIPPRSIIVYNVELLKLTDQ